MQPHEMDKHLEANREWAWLKPHPSISSLTAGKVQNNVGVLGIGKIAYVDSQEQFASLPDLFSGRPYVVSGKTDPEMSGLSFSIDEASDVYLIVPHSVKGNVPLLCNLLTLPAAASCFFNPT